MFTPIPLWLPTTPQETVIRAYTTYNATERIKDSKQRPHSFINILSATTSTNSKAAKWRSIVSAFVEACEHNRYLLYPAKYWVLKKTSSQGVFTGIITGITTTALAAGKLRFHEATLPNRALKLSDYLEAVKIQAEPIVAAYTSTPSISNLLQEAVKAPAFHHFLFEEEKYSLWQPNYTLQEQFHAALATVAHCDLVDGHHRAEAVLKYANINNCLNTTHLLSLLVPASKIQSESFFWFLPKITTKITLNTFENLGHFHPISTDNLSLHSYPITIKLKDQFFGITPKNTVLESLTILHSHLQREGLILRYKPQEKQQTLAAFVEEQSCEFCCSYTPLQFSQVQNLAAQGAVVPPKTTFLHPKLLTGHLIHPM